MATTVGQQLKQARTARGLSLEQVAQVTRIRVLYLQALENDQRAALPSLVQGKGFLRLYASHLNLPLQPLLDLWDGKSPVVEQHPVESQAAAQPIAEDAAGKKLPVGKNLPEGELEQQQVAFVASKLDGAALPQVEQSPPAESSAQAIFIEIGQKLRKQREALGLSRVEVERYTHLRQHYIQAMEEGNQAGLPSPVQGRGLLSNYAAFLNLNEDALLLRYAEALQLRRVERVQPQEPPSLLSQKKRPARQAPFWRRFLTPDLVFGVGLAAAILFFVLWTASRISDLRSEEVEPTPPAIAEILLNPEVEETALTETLPAELVAGSEVSQADLPTDLPVEEQPLPDADTTATSEPPGLSPLNDDPFQVYIVARQRAWLRVITDGSVKFLGRVVPGNAYAFSASKQIELVTGNAAALQVFYNQMDLGVLGNTGEVAGLIFNQQGVLTPTPAFTPTATATPIASVTPQPTPTPQATPTVTPLIP